MTLFSLPSTGTSITSTRFAISIAAGSINSETSAGITVDIAAFIITVALPLLDAAPPPAFPINRVVVVVVVSVVLCTNRDDDFLPPLLREETLLAARLIDNKEEEEEEVEQDMRVYSV
jgi:hypothetical protein